MLRIARKAGAIGVKVVVWALRWPAGTRVARAPLPDIVVLTRPLTRMGVRWGRVVLSVGLSALAGWVTGVLVGREPMAAVRTLAVLQLGLGVVAEVSYWNLLPVWYHLAFLIQLVPAIVVGGRVADRWLMNRPALPLRPR